MALGGLMPLFNIALGEVVIGGVGAGLYGMLVFVEKRFARSIGLRDSLFVIKTAWLRLRILSGAKD
jgi:hypothetical protein